MWVKLPHLEKGQFEGVFLTLFFSQQIPTTPKHFCNMIFFSETNISLKNRSWNFLCSNGPFSRRHVGLFWGLDPSYFIQPPIHHAENPTSTKPLANVHPPHLAWLVGWQWPEVKCIIFVYLKILLYLDKYLSIRLYFWPLLIYIWYILCLYIRIFDSIDICVNQLSWYVVNLEILQWPSWFPPKKTPPLGRCKVRKSPHNWTHSHHPHHHHPQHWI